jgi:hypothetical protein
MRGGSSAAEYATINFVAAIEHGICCGAQFISTLRK